MKQTTEQLKAVRDNAPDGATHSDNERDYFKRTDNTKRSATQWEMWDGHNWYSTHGTPDFALADIEEIISLSELLKAKEKCIAELLGFSEYSYTPDYYGDDRHLMPLVYKHKINLIAPRGDKTNWIAFVSSILETHQNPRIALCMCLIKVLEAEK